MRRIAMFFASVLALALWPQIAKAQPASPVTINCGQTNADTPQPPVNGTIDITWTSFYSNNVLMQAGTEHHNIIRGVCYPAITLTPTDTATGAIPRIPPMYTVKTVNAQGNLQTIATWLVRTSATPLNIADVQQNTPVAVPLPYSNIPANYFLAGPASGGNGNWTVRKIVSADLPNAGITTVPNGGTGDSTLSGILKGNGTSPVTSAAASDVTGLFSGCSGIQYLGADGACHTGGGGGGASSVSQLTDCQSTVSGNVLTINVCITAANGTNYTKSSATVTNSAVSGLTARYYVTDGSDGRAAGTIVVLNSVATGLACANCTVVPSSTVVPQLCGGSVLGTATAIVSPGTWDAGGLSEGRAFPSAGGCRISSGDGNISVALASDGYKVSCTTCGGGGGGSTTLTGDVIGSGTGTFTTTVKGVNSVPLCTGFTPTNGQVLEYTTTSSPNPCYTAANVSGGGTITLTGDVTGTGTGTVPTVVGKLNSVPFCTGYTPTNGQLIQYTTGSSPNPCYTAATVSGSAGAFDISNGPLETCSGTALSSPGSGWSINGSWEFAANCSTTGAGALGEFARPRSAATTDQLGYTFAFPASTTHIDVYMNGFYGLTDTTTLTWTATIGCIAAVGATFNGGTPNTGTVVSKTVETLNTTDQFAFIDIVHTGCNPHDKTYLTLQRSGTYANVWYVENLEIVARP